LDIPQQTVYIIHHPDKVADHVERSLAPAFAAIVENSDLVE
jgi:hypothetical protein